MNNQATLEKYEKRKKITMKDRIDNIVSIDFKIDDADSKSSNNGAQK